MKKEAEKPRLRVKVYLDGGRLYVRDLVKKDPPFLGRLLTDATRADLWRMITIFRGTDLWDKFLRALLSLPQDVWLEHKLVINKSSFQAKEVEQIIGIYEGMGTDVKVREILFDLDYDKYWTRQVQKAGESSLRAAQRELDKARNGLNLGGIPTKASAKCLAGLAAYVNSLKDKKTRK